MAKFFPDRPASSKSKPERIESEHSQILVIDSFPFEIVIYREKGEEQWILEIYDLFGVTRILDAPGSDAEVLQEAVTVIGSAGAFGYFYCTGYFPELAKHPDFPLSVWALERYGTPQASPRPYWGIKPDPDFG